MGVAVCLIILSVYLGSDSLLGFGEDKRASTVAAQPWATDLNSYKTFGKLDVAARDAAQWGVPAPDIAELTSNHQRSWAAERSVHHMDYRGPSSDGYVPPPPYQGTCRNKLENIEVLDYVFHRPGEHVVLAVRYEAETFKFVNMGKGNCGELVPDGKKNMDVKYVWRGGAIGWQLLKGATEDPSFKDSVLSLNR